MRRWKQITSKKKWRAERGALDAREQQERRDYAGVKARARGRCEVELAGRRCPRPDVDTHHTIKRSAGGRFLGEDYLLRVCRPCHGLFDQHPTQRSLIAGTWIRGQMKAAALGGGRFRCWLETAAKTTTRSPGRAETSTNRLSRETSAAFHAPKAPERSEARS